MEKPDWEAINNPQTSCPLRGGERAYSSDCDEAEAEDATSSSSSRYVLATALAHVGLTVGGLVSPASAAVVRRRAFRQRGSGTPPSSCRWRASTSSPVHLEAVFLCAPLL